MKNQVNNSDKLTNTIWVSRVAPECVDTLKFLKNGRLTSYSCEIEYQAKGNYTVKADTVIAFVNEDFHGDVENWRYTYVQKNDKLILIRSEQKFKGKWRLIKGNFEQNYTLRKIK